MNNLIRIVYVSRSTFTPSKQASALEPGIARILAKSRANNRKNGLAGVLYFGDGCFFQCLEGDEAAIDALYAKLEADPRHRDLRLISRERIENPTFAAWSMKYILSEKKIQDLLRVEGLDSFDPYRFSVAATRKMLALLHEADDPQDKADSKSEPPPEPSHSNPRRRADMPPAVPKPGNRRLAFLAFAAVALCWLFARYALH